MGLSELPLFRIRITNTAVSIRRADLGLSELQRRASIRNVANGFNPPGGFGAFGTSCERTIADHRRRFNPPGGFGAFGTDRAAANKHMALGVVSIRRADLGLSEPSRCPIAMTAPTPFQSAGRIWGFRNFAKPSDTAPPYSFQSAGRIWGFRNAQVRWLHRRNPQFQSAGRIWGFRNSC